VKVSGAQWTTQSGNWSVHLGPLSRELAGKLVGPIRGSGPVTLGGTIVEELFCSEVSERSWVHTSRETSRYTSSVHLVGKLVIHLWAH
jgi:hypothetical protein